MRGAPTSLRRGESGRRSQSTCRSLAACEGALEAGATELLVRDAHGTGRNIHAEMLPREASLVRGWSGHPHCMVQGVDGTFTAALLVGWHSAARLGGNPLAHTLSSRRLHAVRVNGAIAAEFHLHAWACMSEGVPVAFVSGDEGLCAEVERFDEAIRAVGVSRGQGASTIAMHPARARDAIRLGVREALEGDLGRIGLALP